MKAMIYQVTRRDFLRQAGVGTGALVLGCAISEDAFGVDVPSVSELIHGIPVKDVPFVAIKLNGDVVIITHRAEMGQGIRSSLAAVLADEMEADWKRVSLRQAPADSTKFGVQFPYPVPPETKLPYPYAKRNLDKPLFIVDADVAQFTDSSRSMAAYYMPMRFYGAALRRAFIHAAAKKWGVEPSECYAEQHKVKHKHDHHRPLDYRRLLLGAQKVPPPDYEQLLDALKEPNEWRYINKEKMRETFNDAAEMVTGKTQYGADIQMRGMLTAMIERCPVANGTVGNYDPTEAMKVPGVVKVMKVSIPNTRLGPGGVGTAFMPHEGVAVLAENTWAAWQGRRKLKPTIEWDLSAPVASDNRLYNSGTFRKTLEESTSEPGQQVRTRGDIQSGFAQATKIVEAGYYVPHLAQAPMEPPVAIARLQGDHLEMWAPTQNPDMAQQMAGVVAFGIPYDDWETEKTKAEMRKKVTLHMPLLGGGFGRKSKPDYVVEAAFLAKENPGVPIRVQWTREDDIQFSYYNAVSHQYLKAGVGADGRPTALLQRSAFTSLFATLFPPPRKDWELNAFFEKKRSDFRAGGVYPYGSSIEQSQGLEDVPFDVPNLRIENCGAKNYIRVGWMRSVANVYHAFAICSFADEMAQAARRDSKDFLLDLIGTGGILDLEKEQVKQAYNNEFPTSKIDVPFSGSKVFQVIAGYPPDTRRLRRTVEEVAKMSDWDGKKGRLPRGRGLGIAAHRSFLSYVALVLDVSLTDKNELTINEAFCAIDCGLAVNIDRVSAQIEGGINYGLSMALLGEITVKDGAVEQNNFDDYPVLRIHQTPKKVSIHIVQTDFDPTGVGEPPTPVVAPALANAIVAAGGPRIREIPFRRHIMLEE